MMSRGLALVLPCLIRLAFGAAGGTFEAAGTSRVSAMMVFLGNENSVYILDKAEGNAEKFNGHPAWGAVWDVNTHESVVQDVRSNSFCASGMHLPNGSFATFGGNDGVGPGGAAGSQKNADGRTGAWDVIYQDFDGRKAIRVVNPCTMSDNLNVGDCAWYDHAEVLSMQRERWYSGVEATGDGEVVIMGGLVTGGFVNRNLPNVDPVRQGGSAEPTYEYYPARPGELQIFNFLTQTSGLNAYVHAYLMPSGRIFVQANLSTILWEHNTNVETPLPPMPKNVVRVYPASGATAMLPLTPANDYTPTMLFCGGSDMPEAFYGDYAGPDADVWTIPASKDCQRITPEPKDRSAVAYQQDDDMLEGRTMGQFIILPDGKMLVINGALNGTAGYALSTPSTAQADMPYGPSLAAGPVLRPAIYDPNAPRGSRWSNAGLGSSAVPRLYHSSAILLPDGSVFLAGSNPNPDVDLQAIFPTEYRVDIFFPPYFSAPIRPAPVGVPKTLSYGGPSFDIIIPATSYNGSSNDAADATQVMLVRGGFTTHAMNMGQRALQLKNAYTVHENGTIVLHVSQLPPNSNIFQPGPALLFVTIAGIPSNGTHVIIGSGRVEKQPILPETQLPSNTRVDSATSKTSGDTSNASDSANSKPSMGLIIGAAAGGLALLILLGGFIACCISRRRRATYKTSTGAYDPPVPISNQHAANSWNMQGNNSAIFSAKGETWDSSTTNLNAPYGQYNDESYSMTDLNGGVAPKTYTEYDPYAYAQQWPQNNYAPAVPYSGPPANGGYGAPQHFYAS